MDELRCASISSVSMCPRIVSTCTCARPDEAFAVASDGKGLEILVERLRALDVALIVLEATGGFETTVAAALAALGCHSPWSIPVRSGTSPALWANSPRPT